MGALQVEKGCGDLLVAKMRCLISTSISVLADSAAWKEALDVSVSQNWMLY